MDRDFENNFKRDPVSTPLELNEQMERFYKKLEERKLVATKIGEHGKILQEREELTPSDLYSTLQEWIEEAKAIRPNDRSATDRYFAMAISKAQELLSFFHYYCVEEEGLDQ